MGLPAVLDGLTPREAVIDAISRAVNGVDENDEQIFRSAFTPEAKFTFFGKTLDGAEAIVSDVFHVVGKLDTTHLVTNHRVHIDEAKARLTATVLAQHFAEGTGMKGDAPRLLGGAHYDVDLVKLDGDQLWRITHWKLNSIWAEGDMSIVGQAIE